MAENTIAADAHIRKHLEQINLHLQVIQAGIVVSANALRLQCCEHDDEIACVLIHNVSERLSVQMERISEIVAEMQAQEFEISESLAEEGRTSSPH
jgi:hypothetical protein